MDKNFEARVHYRLPIGIILTPDCIGKVIDVEILGFQGKLLLPNISWNKENQPYLSAPTISDDGLAELKQRSNDHHIWGAINSWNSKNKTFDSFYLSSFHLQLNLDPDLISYSAYLYGKGHPISDQITYLDNNIDEWFAALSSWISIKTKQDMNHYHPISNVEMPGSGLEVWTEENGVTSLIASANQIIVNIDSKASDTAVSLQDLASAIEKVTAGEIPPDSHLLLRNAREALLRKLPRKAAIDAGTAVELVLRNYPLKTQIKGKPTLGKLVNNTTLALPPETQTKLVDVRNDASHYNSTFNDSLVPEAIDLATNIVERYEPYF